MNIVHVAPNAPYEEGWSYQENLLPKYQAKLGHHVTLLVSEIRHRNQESAPCGDYMSSDGFRVIRTKSVQYPVPMLRYALSYLNIYDLLVELKPDLIFHHGMVSTTIRQAVRYKKKVNPSCVIVQDNHMDYNIGFDPKTCRGKVLRLLYRHLYRSTAPHIRKVYGVTPWREEYARDVFGVEPEKTGVLIMGADDERLDLENRSSIRQRIRQQYHIADDEFLVVTGGKIDEKKKIHLLMDAVKELEGVKLLICGETTPEFTETFRGHQNANVVDAGWVTSDRFYEYFFAADLVCFPGQHSVLWEQACASKVPCVFGKWHGMDHVNNGGNACFVEPVTVEELRNTLCRLQFTEEYRRMLAVANSANTDIYLYSRIARKSLECMAEQ